MAQSYRLCTWLAKVKAVAFAVIFSGYRSQVLLYTHSDQRYIRRYGIHDLPRSQASQLFIYIRAGYE